MPKSSNQKLKILYLMKILLEDTDETYFISMNEIISKLVEISDKFVASQATRI